MSYDPRLASRPYGGPEEGGDDADARKGSVRAARERLQAAQRQGQMTDRSRIVGLPQRPNQLVSQFSSQNRPLQQQNLTSPNTGKNAPAFSPTPNWPLPTESKNDLDSEPGELTRPADRGPAPQRPPRPISQDLLIQQTSTSPREYRESYHSDDVLSPTSGTTSSRPLTTSSAASTSSSLGSIPDFPVPQPPMPTIQPLPRRQPSLGPPPSSRRGPSSYYTQSSYVSPIVEESEARSETIRSHHGSFASSNVIPFDRDDYYMDDEEMLSEDDETITSDYGRESRASDHDDKSGLVQPALVRQASLGRRTKPSIMTIKSVESLPVKRKPTPDSSGSSASVSAAALGGAMLAAREGISSRSSPGGANASLGSGTGLLDPSSSSSDSLASLKNSKSGLSASEARRALDPEKGGLESPIHPLQQPARQMSLADRVGKRRPPKIDVDAVRDAEARGSLTSLPELIRRATRLAANLDRGRTASRLGLDFWENGSLEKNSASRRSGSLSDMLAAFPPPGEATPTGDRTPNKRTSKWPSAGAVGGFGPTDSALSDRKSDRRRRRCCGMPMWTFVTLLIVLLFLVAAAVVVPVVLIVIPKMKNNQNSAAESNSNASSSSSSTPAASVPTTSSQTNQCNGVITCQNGGVAVLQADRSCNCVCINGFTGNTCGTQTDAGCTTTNVANTANNATIGSGIPRLLTSAQNNFSLPLDASTLLSVFSGLGLSCTSENALVTFNGLASRSLFKARLAFDDAVVVVEPTRSLPLSELRQRQAIGEVGKANANANAAAAATSTSVAVATAKPAQPISSNATAIDFARIGVLLALQETRKLDTAANAQEALQTFLTNDRNGDGNEGSTVDLGPFKIDLSSFSLNFGNGTTIQAHASNTTAAQR